jgi:hypothetical protein
MLPCRVIAGPLSAAAVGVAVGVAAAAASSSAYGSKNGSNASPETASVYSTAGAVCTSGTADQRRRLPLLRKDAESTPASAAAVAAGAAAAFVTAAVETRLFSRDRSVLAELTPTTASAANGVASAGPGTASENSRSQPAAHRNAMMVLDLFRCHTRPLS